MHVIPGSRIVSTGKIPFAPPSMDIAPPPCLSDLVIIFYFIYFLQCSGVISIMLNVNIEYIDRMFGLPDITILTVGITIVVAIALLLYWGLTFKGHD
jgi:hypothetical protein